jgi:hypothetical protein
VVAIVDLAVPGDNASTMISPPSKAAARVCQVLAPSSDASSVPPARAAMTVASRRRSPRGCRRAGDGPGRRAIAADVDSFSGGRIQRAIVR